MSLDATARRFGLRASRAGRQTTLRRGDRGVLFDDRFDHPTSQALVAACLGVRLGLDALVDEPQRTPQENVGRLLPSAAIELVARIVGVRPSTSRWLAGHPFEVAVVAQSGKRMWLVDDDPAQARRTAFYEAYKLRPSQKREVGAGTLAIYRRPAASAIAPLFPDFDVDASRAHGALLIPGFDTVAVFRPAATPRWSEVRQAGRELFRAAAFPLSRRLVHLRTDAVMVGHSVDAIADLAADSLTERLVSIDA